MSEYERSCMHTYCGKPATKEVQTRAGNWIPLCEEHISERAYYVREIKKEEIK